MLTALTIWSLSKVSSSMKVTQTHNASISMIRSMTFVPKKNRVLQRAEAEYLVHYDDASAVCSTQNFVYPDQIVLQFAAKIADVLLSLEMGQDLIEQKKSRAAAGNKTTEARQDNGAARTCGRKWFFRR